MCPLKFNGRSERDLAVLFFEFFVSNIAET
jgi:hypothetical protein